VATRNAKLKDKLQMGDNLATEEKNQLEQISLTQFGVFALTDEELGETNLVTHSINTGKDTALQITICVTEGAGGRNK